MTEPGTAVDGQGAGESEGSIFDPYLQAVPEGWDNPPQGSPREIVSGYLKDAEKGVNSKLQEAAELQKQFGDYKEIDLSGVTPEQLSQVIEFVNQVNTPEAYQDWLRNEATEAGLIQQEQQEQGPEDQDLEAYIQTRIQQALDPVTQKLSQFEQSNQESKQEQVQREMETHIETTLSRLEAENKLKLNDEQQEAVLALGDSVQGKDFVEQGFQKYLALTGAAQTSFVKDKANQPTPSLRTGGQPAPAKGKNFADVREQAMEILNQAL